MSTQEQSAKPIEASLTPNLLSIIVSIGQMAYRGTSLIRNRPP